MNTNNPALILTVLLALCYSQVQARSAQSQAQSRASTERAFANWVNGPLWQRAQAQNISRSVFKTAFRSIKLNWSLPDLRPPGQSRRARTPSRQSEFRAPGGYFKARHLAYNIKTGRAKMKAWRRTLDKIEQRYGVPREIIISIWGKETAFGAARLPYRALQVLATQAFMGRRKALFEKELLAALTIVQQKHISARNMKSAWAGALGHPQFMPTAFLKYAVDFDGDGSKNIWTSVPDALASIAHFLQQNGWDKSQHWGRRNHDCLPAFHAPLRGQIRQIMRAQWQRSGVTLANGASLGHKHSGPKRPSCCLPAGRHGPTFLVSKNFYVLKTYNESDVYALFIGHVADQMRGAGPFKKALEALDQFFANTGQGGTNKA